MNKLTTCFIALSVLSSVHCDNAESGNSSSAKSRYGLKQACIEYKITGDMVSGTDKLYFDHYGLREAKYSQQTVKAMGIKQETHTATFMNFDEDGVIYTYDFKTKSGTKMENPLQESFEKEDMKEVGKQMMVAMGGKKIGTGKVLGKTCEIWEVMGSKTWIWNWLNLKTEVKMMGMNMTTEATKISETFDKKKLQKPNVKYRDMSDVMGGFQGLDMDALKKKYQKK